MATVVWERDSAVAEPIFFPVSVPKLIAMSVLTLGLYQYYWFYKNWKLIQARSRTKMIPFWRAVFAVFWAHSLFERIARRAQDEGVRPLYSPSPMAGLFILLTLSTKLPDPYWLVTFLAILPVVPVHRTAMEVNRRVTPDAAVNAHFSALNVIGVLIGGAVLLLGILEMLVL